MISKPSSYTKGMLLVFSRNTMIFFFTKSFKDVTSRLAVILFMLSWMKFFRIWYLESFRASTFSSTRLPYNVDFEFQYLNPFNMSFTNTGMHLVTSLSVLYFTKSTAPSIKENTNFIARFDDIPFS